MTRRYHLETHSGPAPDFERDLNPEQYAAVTAPGGPVMVIAGAGSGKTRTLTYRVAYLLSRGVSPSRILLLTFTNKAAREMLDRVADLTPAQASGIWGGTFHSIGNRILRQHAERLGYRRGFSILDREDSEELISATVASEGLAGSDRRFPKASVLSDIFGLSTNTGKSIREVLGQKYRYFIPLSAQIEHVQLAYMQRKLAANVMDFDDLLCKSLELFHTCEDVADEYRERFQHVLVDEYQDTNRLEAGLVEQIARRHGNLMVVGDDAQSIYSWRGADFENILQFPRRHPDATIYKIETNYRSVPQVLEVANAAILGNERQFPKSLTPSRGAHSIEPALVPLPTNNAQAAFVAQRILELEQEGIDPSEVAVLYRAHFHSMEIQLEFTRRGIPFAITSGIRFFEQAHIKDLSAFLRLAVNPDDESAFKRIVRLLPGIGVKGADNLWRQAAPLLNQRSGFAALNNLRVTKKAQPAWNQLVETLKELAPGGKPLAPSPMIESVLFAMYDDIMQQKFANYDSRREDITTLAGFAGQFSDPEEFLSQLALLAGIETAEALNVDTTGGKVSMSTIHQAKGLEWKVVFLVWLTDGMFPHSRCLDDPAQLEEERRLFYVAVTRCKDELYLTYPEMRVGAGYGDAFQRPSRFLGEIPDSLLENWELNNSIPDQSDSPF